MRRCMKLKLYVSLFATNVILYSVTTVLKSYHFDLLVESIRPRELIQINFPTSIV